MQETLIVETEVACHERDLVVRGQESGQFVGEEVVHLYRGLVFIGYEGVTEGTGREIRQPGRVTGESVHHQTSEGLFGY